MNIVKSENPIFVSSKEIGRIFGISKSGVYNLIVHVDFPIGVKIGRSRRWRLSDVEAWINAQESAMKGAVNA